MDGNRGSNFFKAHWLGIFLSSVLAGVVATFLYDHWPFRDLLSLVRGPTPSVATSADPAPMREEAQTQHANSDPSQSPASQDDASGIRDLATSSTPNDSWADYELVVTPASGKYQRYLPLLPLRDMPRTLAASELITGLRSAGFQGVIGSSQWPQWIATAEVAGEYVPLSTSAPRIIEDRTTGLDWYVADAEDERTWEQASLLVQRLNRDPSLGQEKWHLPTTEELASILKPEDRSILYNTRLDHREGGFCIDRLLQPETLPRTNAFGRYWSSDQKNDDWIWTLETGAGCGFHNWRRNYGADVLAVRKHRRSGE